MTAYYVIIESVTTLWLWVGWLWKCNIPMTQSVRRLSIIRSVCHNFLKGVICKIMHIIYKIVKMAPRHCSVVGCKSSSKTMTCEDCKKIPKRWPKARWINIHKTIWFCSARISISKSVCFQSFMYCRVCPSMRTGERLAWQKILFWLCEY